MLALSDVLGNIFVSKPLRNTILVYTPMLSMSMNPIMLNKSTFSRWPPYKYQKWLFKPQEIPRYVMLYW